MNRYLLIPLLVSSIAFVAFCLNTSTAKELKQIPATFESSPDAMQMLNAETARNRVETAWKNYDPQKMMMSRAAPRPRPRARATASFQERAEEDMTGFLMGTFKLTSDDATQDFPVVIDRNTGDASIYVNGYWSSFERWQIFLQGVEL
ncbi:MAG: hypothetical protein ACR2NP_16870 [Pirellulaceae bacterium]